MSSPAATSNTSSLSPPPSTLSSPSPEPSLEDTPPPKPVARRKPKSKDPAKTKSPKKKGKEVTKITLKLKQPLATDRPEKDKIKKPLPKPREPKIEPIPRSVVNNFDVPLVCLFRTKFRALFGGTSELGPQDIEEGVNVEGDMEGKLEEFVCRICTLIGNRRKNVEHENLGKILQETVDSCVEKIGFRKDGINTSPMLNTTYASMDWDARLQLLRSLIHWALLSSDAVRQIIDDGYKVPQNSRMEREELDINTGLGVLPLATIKNDNYYLIEGKDTRFRIYHCTNPSHKIVNISSVAEDKPSLLAFAEKLSTGSKQEQDLGATIRETIIAKIEAAEQRRLKAEQTALRLAMWKAQAPVYNTRTRGKRVDYTELERDSGSDDDEDSRGGRRSERNRDREIVEYTASGRMVKRPKMDNGTEIRESRLKDEDGESEEEMEWSVYSDKGEETDGVDDEQEGEEDEYDLGRRTLVVKFRLSKDRLKAVTTMGDCIPVNGLPKGPQKSSDSRPVHNPAQHISKSHQPQYSQFHYYSPPQAYTPTIPHHSPYQNAAPLPYTGGASPPLASRPVQLSPRPIPQPSVQSPSQVYPQPSPYRSYQTSPRAKSSESPRQSPYAVAQFQPQPSPPHPQPMHASPQSYPPVNGMAQESPSLSAQPALESTGPGWSPPRPFRTSPHSLGASVYNKAPTPTASGVSPQHPVPGSPHQSDVSPPKPTWSAASFQSNSLANGTPHHNPEQPH